VIVDKRPFSRSNQTAVAAHRRGVPHSPKESGGNHFRRLFRLFGDFSNFAYFLGIGVARCK